MNLISWKFHEDQLNDFWVMSKNVSVALEVPLSVDM